MMNRRYKAPALLALSLMGGFLIPQGVAAQLTDVSGANSTSFNMQFGIVGQQTTAQTNAINTAAGRLGSQLSDGTLINPETGTRFSAATQSMLADVMVSGVGASALVAALSAGFGEGGSSAIQKLVETLDEILSSPYPGQLSQAAGFFDIVIDSAPASYLANPPEAFVAVHTVLQALANAAFAAD